MELKVLSSADKTLHMEIIDEDISIGDILHHELLKDDHTVFAGIVKQHPLLNRLTLKIQTKEKDPLDVLVSSSSDAVKKAAEILSEIKKNLDEKKEA